MSPGLWWQHSFLNEALLCSRVDVTDPHDELEMFLCARVMARSARGAPLQTPDNDSWNVVHLAVEVMLKADQPSEKANLEITVLQESESLQ